MFESLKTLWKKRVARRRIMTHSPASWRGKSPLEGELQGDPGNGEVQKALMLVYNRALSVYAKSHTHRQK